jgi:DNA-binding NarL/FixJ family response regulator
MIADDQALVRAGFRMIIETDPQLRVVAEAADGAEAVQAARRERPDIVLMDIRMPGTDGLEATRQIVATQRSTRVLILTTFDLDEYVFQALAAGASGFLLKDVAPESLLSGIHTTLRGEALLAPTVTRRLIESYIHRPPVQPPPELSDLTPRELEILQLVARGLSNAEIAEHLVVSTTTVKTHVARVLAKLSLRDRTQAVILAYESGIVRPGSS